MHKLKITIDKNQELDVVVLAKELQRFIIEDDYALGTIVKKLEQGKRIALDVSVEKNMPDFQELIESFDEDEVAYSLFQFKDGEWSSCTLDELDLERNRLLVFMIGLAILGYLATSFVEIFFIYDWYTQKYEFSGIFATIGATITAYVPVVGSLFAYWSATELAQHDALNMFLLFFWYYTPVVGFFLYLAGLIGWLLYKEKFYNLLHPEFRR